MKTLITYTNDEIIRNRKEVDLRLAKIAKLASEANLHYVAVVHADIFTKELDWRVSYFEEIIDAIEYENNMRNIYEKLDIPFHIYIM